MADNEQEAAQIAKDKAARLPMEAAECVEQDAQLTEDPQELSERELRRMENEKVRAAAKSWFDSYDDPHDNDQVKTLAAVAFGRDTIYLTADSNNPEKWESCLMKSINDGTRDTLGGVISCKVCNVPVGLGEPVYGKLHAQLAAAMMSIPSVHGFEYGDGFGMASCRGSEVMDVFEKRADGTVGTSANHSGGIQGGISNGEDITMRIAFKPVPTLMRDVPTIDRDGNPVTLAARGRHDVCVINRALPVVESMAALVILDNYLIRKTNVL